MDHLLLIGVYRSDWEADPENVGVVVAGVVDGGTWEVEGVDDTERRWKACKAAYDPTGADYEWREVWIKLDNDALLKHFNPGRVTAEVAAPKETGS